MAPKLYVELGSVHPQHWPEMHSAFVTHTVGLCFQRSLGFEGGSEASSSGNRYGRRSRNQAIRRVGASHGSTLSAAVGVANALRVCRICSSRRCITIPCTQNSTRGIVQDRTAGLASLVEGFILKLQLASLQVVVWWPPILLPGQPALCSSVMAFAPSSTSVGFATFIVTYTGSYRFLYGEHGPVMGSQPSRAWCFHRHSRRSNRFDSGSEDCITVFSTS